MGILLRGCMQVMGGHLLGTVCNGGHVAKRDGREPQSTVSDFTVCALPIPEHPCFLQTRLCSTCASLVTLL